jgi:thiol-disulfide isomerase/thioredoxin
MCFQYRAYSQNLNPLRIGDTVPDLEMQNIVNYRTAKARLSDFKGKLLILDFWGTWCAPCIGAFPKLDSLQRKFKDEIEILPVTAESKSTVSDFLAKMNKIKNWSPHSVTDDRILGRLFPHIYLPHYVWINQSGKVVAITESTEVNANNIHAMLNNEETSLSVKKDRENFIVDGEAGNYFLFAPSVMMRNTSTLENLPREDVRFQSLLTRYIQGLGSGGNFDPKGTWLYLQNMTVFVLYRTAFSGNSMKSLNNNSLIIDIPDSILFDKIKGHRRSSNAETQNWLEEYGYCYTIRVSPELASKKEEIMLRELNDYFGALYGIEGKKENRNCKYLALVRTNKEIKFAAKGKESTSSTADKFSLRIVNASFQTLVEELTLPLQKYPLVFDETGYSGKVDLELNCQLSDLKALNKELDRYGLQLVEKEKMMNVGVIRMKK